MGWLHPRRVEPGEEQGLRATTAALKRRVWAKAFLADRWLLTKSLRRYTQPRDDMLRLGSDYGGWWVPTAVLGQDSIVYSVGVGEDTTFDVELSARFSCTVHAFDPTPRAGAHVRAQRPPRFVFAPIALWTFQGTLRLFAPATASHVSLSVNDRDGTGEFFEVACDTLTGLRGLYGHNHVDLLKMDIEGAEAAVLDWLIDSLERPGVIAVECELHEPWWRTRRRLLRLLGCGYVHVMGEAANHVFVQQAPT